MIDSYRFGEIVIDGRRYTSDVIIFPHRVRGDWWRREGHQLHPDDLQEALKEPPEVFVVGTGISGMMRVLDETRRLLESQAIQLVAQSTDEACQTYNQLSVSKRVVAALHLTC